MRKRNTLGGRLKKSKVREITPKILDEVVRMVVEDKMGLRKVCLHLNIAYSVLIRHINENQEARDLIDEARQWTVFDLGQELVEIADTATKQTLDLDRFRVQVRKDSVNLLSRTREAVARSRPQNAPPAQTINVGVVLVPHKATPAMPAPSATPRLAVVNGQVLEGEVVR